MNSPTMVPVFAPDGSLGDVPYERLHEALAAGGKIGVNIQAPDGSHGVVPADRYQDAVKAGAKVTPLGAEKVDEGKPGFWSTLGSDLKDVAANLPGAIRQGLAPITGGQVDLKGPAAAVAADEQRQQQGRGPLYRAGALAATMAGANVPGMEQAAEQGNSGAVLGHAAAGIAPYAAGAAAGAARDVLGPKVEAAAQSKAAEMYQSALKPSTRLSPTKVANAVQTGLEAKIPVSEAGVEKLSALIEDLNDKIAATVERGNAPQPPPRIAGLLPAAPTEIPLAAPTPGQMPGGLVRAVRPGIPPEAFSPEARIARGASGLSPIRLTDAQGPEAPFRYYATKGETEIGNAPQPTAGVLITRDPHIANRFAEPSKQPYVLPNGKTIDPHTVVQRLDELKAKFANQVNPDADLAAIEAAKQEFLKNNPSAIPVAKAQAMKQGTYKQLGSRSYGELKSAQIEAQKALARGIKEELATQFPELKGLNARESQFLNLEPLLEKAVQRINNHQLIGIGTPAVGTTAAVLTGSKSAGALAGVLKMVVDNPAVKSRLAIALSRAGLNLPTAVARLAAYSSALAQGASSANDEAPENRTTEP